MIKFITGIIVIALLIIGGLAIFGGADGSGDVVTLGLILPLTGDAASYGESELKAMQVAVEEINAAGGVFGKKFELVAEDGKCDQAAAGIAAEKLVASARIIIGGACSGETLAAAEVTDSLKVLLISPSASDPKVSDAGDFVFRTHSSDTGAGRIAARYASEKLNVQKAALITEMTDYAQGLREAFKARFTELGGAVVADETFETGDADFRAQILKIKNAKPDVVYMAPQTVAPGIALVKKLRDAEVTAKIMTTAVLLDRKTVAENAAILEGVLGVESAIDWENNPKAKAFREAHERKFGFNPGSFAANAYDAVYLIRDAIEAVKSTDTEKIRDWLYGVKNWEGAVGKITIDMKGDPIMGENVREIKNGQVTDLGVYEP